MDSGRARTDSGRRPPLCRCRRGRYAAGRRFRSWFVRCRAVIRDTPSSCLRPVIPGSSRRWYVRGTQRWRSGRPLRRLRDAPMCNATVTAGGHRAVAVTESAPAVPPAARTQTRTPDGSHSGPYDGTTTEAHDPTVRGAPDREDPDRESPERLGPERSGAERSGPDQGGGGGGYEGILRRQSLRESAARTYARSLPIVPVRARGLTIEGADGRRYLDCLSGAGTLALGHNHPVVLEAIRKVLESGAPLHVLDLATPRRTPSPPSSSPPCRANSPTTPASSSADRPARTPWRRPSNSSAPPPAAAASSPSPAPTTA